MTDHCWIRCCAGFLALMAITLMPQTARALADKDLTDATDLNSSQSILIQRALIIDGSGSSGKIGDLRIQGDRIVDIGKLVSREGETTVDAEGLVLAPGFIDTHSHHDMELSRLRVWQQL